MNGATRRSVRLLVLITFAVVGVAEGCGGGDDNASDTSATTATTAPGPATTARGAVTSGPTGTTAAPPGGAACRGLKKVSDLDERTKGLLSENADWDTVKNFLVTESPSALEGYGEAAAGAPPEVAGDIRILQDFTAKSLDVARESTSLTDFATKAAALPGAGDAGAAGQRVDSYARETCGFGVS